MAAFDYNKAHSVAIALITKFGQGSQAVKKGNASGWDESTGDPIAATPDLVILGMVTPLLQYNQNEIDGESIKIGDSYVFFDAFDGNVEIDMMFTINGNQFRVVSMYRMVSVDNIKVFNKIQLRK